MKIKENAAKIIIAIGLIIWSVVLVVNFMANETESAQKNVTMILKSKYGSKWEQISNGAKAAANEYGINLSILAPDYDKDVISQKSLVEGVDQDGKTGLIISPIETNEILSITDKMKQVPITFLMTPNINNNDLDYTFVNSDFVQIGELIRRKLEQLERGKILLVSSRTDYNRSEIENTVKNFCQANPGFEIIGNINSLDDSYMVEIDVNKFLDQEVPELIIAMDTNSTVGACEALKGKSIRGVTVIGRNIFDKDLTYLENGQLTHVIEENYFAIGYLSLKNMYFDMVGAQNRKDFSIPPYSVDRTTMYSKQIQYILFPIK